MNATTKRIEEILTSSYSTDNYVELINEIFSTVRIIAPDRMHEERSNFSYHISGYVHVGTYNTSDDKLLLIFAVKLQKQSGIERARSMQRNFAKKLIESGNADAALVAFYAEDDPKWRLSFVRLDYEMKIENGKLKAMENLTPAKRYSFLVGDKEPCHTALSHFHSFIVDNNSNPTLDELEEAFSVERVTQEFFDLYCEKYQQLRDWLVSNEDFVAESERCHFTVEQFAKKLLGQIVFLYFLQKKGWLGVGVWPQMLTEKEYKNLFFTPGAQGRIIKEYLPILYVQSGENYVQTSRFRSALDQIPDDAEELIANKMPHSRNWGSGSQTFLRTLFDYATKNGGHFYEKYLEPLFYDTLNKNRGVLGYTPILHCRIPFLSGGLFEPIDGFDWKSTHFDIPDEIFSNKQSPDDRQADGILDIFDRYNFTMSEDEPLEREVAIDPEMLGKVFENLLEVKDRKSKGAFYTPREIVHYMCRESLINYLVGQTGISESAIRDLIIYGDFMKDEDTVKSKRQGQGDMFISEEIFKVDDDGNVLVNRLGDIDQALMSVRVVDLAVGSGAFPLGLLNEIVRARETLTEYMAVVERTKAVSEEQGRFFVRELRSQRTPYNLKRYTIKNSIFAADIEPSAVDIAQLRLWLSLVIDDEINPNAQTVLDGHVNPMPLPNLECNILCGNSLVDEFEGTQLVLQSDLIGTAKEGESYSWHQQAWETMLPKLIKAQDELFYCDDTVKKQEIIDRINAIRHKMIGLQLESLPEDKKEEFRAADKRASKPFVLWQLEFARVFHEKGGFDIVIGNPPYIQLQKEADETTGKKLGDQYARMSFETFAKTGDIYCLFYEKGYRLLRDGGVLTFITSNKWMRAGYGEKLRNFFANKTNPLLLIDFAGTKVFASATVDVNILMFAKAENAMDTICCIAKDDCLKNLSVFVMQNSSTMNFDHSNSWNILSTIEIGIKQKIEAVGIPLRDWNVRINRGILTGFNEAFIISGEKRDELVAADPKSAEIIRPILRGRDIKRYGYTFANLWVINTHNGVRESGLPLIDISDYPAIKAHLDKYYPKLVKRADKGDTPYNLRNCAYMDDLTKQKIVWGEISDKPKFAIDVEGTYCPEATTFLMTGLHLKYLLCFLNSTFSEYFFAKYGTTTGMGTLRWKKYLIELLPIPEPTADVENDFEVALDDLLNADSAEKAERHIERINHLVYHTIGLTQEEIDTVEKMVSEGAH